MLVLFRAVRFFDVLAPPVTLNIGGHQSLKTVGGGLVSILYLGVVLAAAYMSVMKYFDNTNPDVTKQVLIRDNARDINLHSYRMLPILTFYYQGLHNLNLSEVSKFLTMDVYTLDYHTTIDSNNGELDNKVEYVTVETVPCKTLIDNGTFQEMYKDVQVSATFKREIEEYGLCLYHPNSSLLSVYGSYEEGRVRSLRIEGLPCSREDNSTCATADELRQIQVQNILPLANVDYSNYETPVTYKFKNMLDITIEPKQTATMSAKIKTEIIYKYSGFLSSEQRQQRFVQPVSQESFMTGSKVKKNTAKLHCTHEDIFDLGTCESHFAMSIWSSNEETITVRSYRGIVETLGEIGGNKQIIDFVFILIHAILLHYALRLFYLQEIFGIGLKISRRIGKRIMNNMLQPRRSTVGTNTVLPLKTGGLNNAKLEDSEFEYSPDRLKEIKKNALSLVEKTLDVVTIVKELHKVRILSQILLRKRHRVLAPVYRLSTEMRRHNPSKAIRKVSTDNTDRVNLEPPKQVSTQPRTRKLMAAKTLSSSGIGLGVDQDSSNMNLQLDESALQQGSPKHEETMNSSSAYVESLADAYGELKAKLNENRVIADVAIDFNSNNSHQHRKTIPVREAIEQELDVLLLSSISEAGILVQAGEEFRPNAGTLDRTRPVAIVPISIELPESNIRSRTPSQNGQKTQDNYLPVQYKPQQIETSIIRGRENSWKLSGPKS